MAVPGLNQNMIQEKKYLFNYLWSSLEFYKVEKFCTASMSLIIALYIETAPNMDQKAGKYEGHMPLC